ncbi:DUF4233 domain-containing protein [Amnibacterium kyonggiense]
MTAPRPARRPRSVVATLAAMLLATELLVVLLAALALLGLKDLPPAVALGGGGALVVVIAVAAALATRPAGIVLGWAVQVVLLATFAVSIPVGIVGVVFTAIWVYAMIVGRRIDRRDAQPSP